MIAAREAAALVGGFLAVPPIPGDFNDYINSAKGGNNASCEVIYGNERSGG